ncbi:hypothetical protein C8Q76DRAFT_706410 [Earliella scabrosa]|nr:hypothetical protein C8Q76DRAFT_706410 [Earliella scabrosa]
MIDEHNVLEASEWKAGARWKRKRTIRYVLTQLSGPQDSREGTEVLLLHVRPCLILTMFVPTRFNQVPHVSATQRNKYTILACTVQPTT